MMSSKTKSILVTSSMTSLQEDVHIPRSISPEKWDWVCVHSLHKSKNGFAQFLVLVK